MLAAMIKNVFFAEPLFDALPDVVFFVKDREGRYQIVNRTLAERCGVREKTALIGRTAADVFPGLGASYLEQDKSVIATGAEIRDQLELHLYPDRDPGWCLTCKVPLRDEHGAVVGLAGISRDLAMPDKKHPVYRRIAAAARFIQDHYDQQVQLADLARIADLSVSQVERYFHKIFHLTPRQMIIQTRLNAASNMLSGDSSVTDIAAACGYHDHSAFTRQFKATIGVTPTEYRALLRRR
ncbi:MAG TPA: AraC family transcriptional regulator [Paucimonas sp.]|nr:AraC family transcriptional regulator [Paucimonas sp.]